VEEKRLKKIEEMKEHGRNTKIRRSKTNNRKEKKRRNEHEEK
jgi:hypothetical protein